jgi:hypothetical protein
VNLVGGTGVRRCETKNTVSCRGDGSTDPRRRHVGTCRGNRREIITLPSGEEDPSDRSSQRRMSGEPTRDRSRAQEEKLIAYTRELESALDGAGRGERGTHPRPADDAIICNPAVPRIVVNKSLETPDILCTGPGVPGHVEDLGDDNRSADLDSLEEIRGLDLREEKARS